MLARGFATTVCSLCVLGCGGGPGGPANDCSDLAGSYGVTTEIVSTDCLAGLHAIKRGVTWTFAQTAPSCAFTMTNSLYPSSTYKGYFTMQGSQASVTWTEVQNTPTELGYTIAYTAERLTVTPAVAPAAAALVGSFDWTISKPCSGTTNVCRGPATSCLTPG